MPRVTRKDMKNCSVIPVSQYTFGQTTYFILELNEKEKHLSAAKEQYNKAFQKLSISHTREDTVITHMLIDLISLNVI